MVKPRYNEVSKAYSLEYHKSKLKRIPLDLQIEEYNAFKAACGSEKVNTVLRRLIREYTKSKQETE